MFNIAASGYAAAKMKSPWVSDWVNWVAMECSRHDLSIFPGMFDSGQAGNWVVSLT
jgi:hypothetical protein